MRRVGNLWERVTSFENLVAAAREARKGKRDKEAVQRFEARREEELLAIQEELRSGSYQPGPYHDFWVYEPVKRLISAASYDRVVHHETLKEKIRRAIKGRPTLELIDRIIDSSPVRIPAPVLYRRGQHLGIPIHPRDHGIPIGNLTSQLFANVYLDRLDHELGHDPRVLAQVRYVDDIVCFGASRRDLLGVLELVREHLARIHLELHPKKTLLRRCREGAAFLGFFARPGRVRIRRKNLARGRRRMQKQARLYLAGELTKEEVRQSVQSWFSHLAHGHTWKLRQALVRDFRRRVQIRARR